MLWPISFPAVHLPIYPLRETSFSVQFNLFFLSQLDTLFLGRPYRHFALAYYFKYLEYIDDIAAVFSFLIITLVKRQQITGIFKDSNGICILKKSEFSTKFGNILILD